ncbi:Phage integrase family site specific recombinase [Pseudomonas amygdali pv. tabaci]|uniref:Phage integrase family site specific recombinase n=1 Tax=Pseudomonas amygdali pv. tabaci TaxID=322 RepID=A0AAX1VWD9_PSEAJ|nr:Phage integrase family site specific recombinase [Pseudomonas amygdali pv. tabaci]
MQDVTKIVTDDPRRLTAVEFQQLARVPSAVEWFANLDNPRTRRAYQNDLTDFSSFIGLASADDFRQVTRSHVLAWRAGLEHRGLAGATIRRKLAALASLFDHLLENNAVAGGNPVHGVKRPRIDRKQRRQDPGFGRSPGQAVTGCPRHRNAQGVA